MATCYVNCRFLSNGTLHDTCFVIEDERFAFVGSREQAFHLYPHARRIDLGGSFVSPGFNDSHMHLLSLGGALAQAQLAKYTSSLSAMLEALRVFSASHPDESWVLGRGWNQDYFSDASRFPTRDDLDMICPDRPCMITRACGHIVSVNSKALSLAGMDKQAPIIDGGKVYTDENGRPNGVLAENAISLISSLLPKPDIDTIKRRLILAMDHVHAFGITSVHSDDFSALDVPFEWIIQAYAELKAEGKMTVRVTQQCLLPTLDDLSRFLDAGYKTGWGDEWFRIGPLKLLTDGSLGARTAYLRAPYSDAPQTRGIPIYAQDTLNAIVIRAHQAGMQIAAHAIGDAAADQVLHAIELAQTAYPRKNARHGIVHAQVFTKQQAERAAKLNMHAYIQPIFLDYDTQIVHTRLADRAEDAYPAASLLAAGVTISGGSDSPVEPPDVMEGIECAVTRLPVTRREEHPYLPQEALSIHQAFELFTVCGAYASFEESVKGRIQTGYLADFVVLGKNPCDLSPELLHDIPVTAVYLGGRQVFPI